MFISTQAIAQILRAMYPPKTVVHVGWGNGLGDLTQWTGWQVPYSFVIEAEENKVAACKSQALSLIQDSGQASTSWQTIHATLAAQSCDQNYFLASNPSESGLLSPDSLQHAWPHLQTLATNKVVTSTLDEIWQDIALQFPEAKSARSTWVIIDCLLSADILIGGKKTLESANVVCARSLLSNRAVLCEAMQALGWLEAGWVESQHPAFGHAWFTRDTALELEVAANKQVFLEEERQALIQSWVLETQAKEHAEKERNTLAHAKSALQGLLDAFEKNIAELKIERNQLTKTNEVLQSQLTEVTKVKSELQEELIALADAQSDLQSELEAADKQQVQLLSERDALSQSLAEETQAKELAQSETQALAQAKEQILKERDGLAQAKSALQSQLDSVTKGSAELKDQLSQQIKSSGDLQSQLAEVTEAKELAQSEAQALAQVKEQVLKE